MTEASNIQSGDFAMSAEPSSNKKLAGIVAIDVAGYSRHTEADEDAAIKSVTAIGKLVIEAARIHGGRVFNTAGDGFMLEFPAASAALAAAEDITAAANPPVRIGVHLGEVSPTPGGDLLGHGVNVAARLQQMALPGAVLVSGDVKRAIRGVLRERLRPQGSVRLDKMSEVIPVFALAPATGGKARGKRLKLPVAATVVGLLGVVLLLCGVLASREMHLGFGPAANAATRIAVLPFQPIGAAPELRDTAANLSDSLQTALSSSQIETVSSADAANLQAPDQDRRLRTLGVGLLFDGTVRRDGDTTAVRLHLDDPLHHASLWSVEISAPAAAGDPLQAQVAARAVAVMKCAAEMLRPSGGLADPALRSLYLHACDLLETQGWGDDAQAVVAFQDTLKQLVARAPGFAPGHAMLAYALSSYLAVTPADQVERLRAQAKAEAQRALAADPKNVLAHLALYNSSLPHDVSGRERVLDAAVQGDPLSAAANGQMGWFLADVGRLQDALPFLQKATAANPWSLDWTDDMVLAWMGRPEDANAEISRLLKFWPEAPQLWLDRLLVARQQGRWKDARALIEDPVGRPKTFDETILAANRSLNDALETRDPKKLQSIQQGVMAGLPAMSPMSALDLPTLIASLAQLGFVDESLRAGDRYAAIESQASDNDVGDGVFFSPLAANLRRDPRFMGFAAKLGLVAYWRSTGKWPDFCFQPGLPYDCKAEAAKYA